MERSVEINHSQQETEIKQAYKKLMDEIDRRYHIKTASLEGEYRTKIYKAISSGIDPEGLNSLQMELNAARQRLIGEKMALLKETQHELTDKLEKLRIDKAAGEISDQEVNQLIRETEAKLGIKSNETITHELDQREAEWKKSKKTH